MILIGYCVWDTKTNKPWNVPYKGAAFRFARKETAMKWCRPGKDRTVVPLYADPDGRWEDLQR